MMDTKDFITCCTTCKAYWTCESKWYRGERGEKNVCCKLCNSYDDCLIESARSGVLLKRGLAKTDKIQK